jgi:hypothetical protein
VSALAVALLLCVGCGSSSPSSPAPLPTPVPIEGVLVINGSVGGKFTFSSSPSKLSHSFFGCGDATVTLPYKETAGGSVVGADYEVRVLDINGFVNRDTGKATNITIGPRQTGDVTITERFLCVEYTADAPPRAQVSINFAGTVHGTVSQLVGTGDLTLVE